MIRRIAIGALAAFTVLILIFIYVQRGSRDPAAVPSVLVGKPLPPFTLPALPGRAKRIADGGEDGLQLSDLQRGHVTIVNIWASYCVPCRVEHPTLQNLARRAGVRLYGINYKDKAGDALAFLIENGDPFDRIGRDADGRTVIDWGVYGVPETFVIDGKGRVIARIAGALTDRDLETVIKPALARAN